ncbi:Uncharacterised protein [Mycobacteroides abscessus]|uniref:Uncharacterized protein n=1 Tax=Mycobacteroides abscessus TaxID=36809 RepID=A0AB33TFG2_9MYCO|nr:Uncharacterised protein [Mycobacteroides abscessus]
MGTCRIGQVVSLVKGCKRFGIFLVCLAADIPWWVRSCHCEVYAEPVSQGVFETVVVGLLGCAGPCDETVRSDEHPVGSHRLDRTADDEGHAVAKLPAEIEGAVAGEVE